MGHAWALQSHQARAGSACGHGLFLNGTIMGMFSFIRQAIKKRWGKGKARSAQEAAA
jgi:hypothetical protein